jgi:hypothetical protein
MWSRPRHRSETPTLAIEEVFDRPNHRAIGFERRGQPHVGVAAEIRAEVAWLNQCDAYSKRRDLIGQRLAPAFEGELRGEYAPKPPIEINPPTLVRLRMRPAPNLRMWGSTVSSAAAKSSAPLLLGGQLLHRPERATTRDVRQHVDAAKPSQRRNQRRLACHGIRDIQRHGQDASVVNCRQCSERAAPPRCHDRPLAAGDHRLRQCSRGSGRCARTNQTRSSRPIPASFCRLKATGVGRSDS